MNIADDAMELKINSFIGSMNEEIDIKKEGKDMLIGFNPKFFIDALRVIDEEDVNIYMVNPKAPCFIKDEKENYIYLILPVNFNTSANQKRRTMEIIQLREDYIKLGQALKAAGLVGSGVEAKIVISEGLVKVNGKVEMQRGKKLVHGDVVSFENETIKIEK